MFHRHPQRDQIAGRHQLVAVFLRRQPFALPDLVGLLPAAPDGHLVHLRRGLPVSPEQGPQVEPEPVPLGVFLRGQHLPVELFFPLLHDGRDCQLQEFLHLLLRRPEAGVRVVPQQVRRQVVHRRHPVPRDPLHVQQLAVHRGTGEIRGRQPALQDHHRPPALFVGLQEPVHHVVLLVLRKAGVRHGQHDPVVHPVQLVQAQRLRLGVVVQGPPQHVDGPDPLQAVSAHVLQVDDHKPGAFHQLAVVHLDPVPDRPVRRVHLGRDPRGVQDIQPDNLPQPVRDLQRVGVPLRVPQHFHRLPPGKSGEIRVRLQGYQPLVGVVRLDLESLVEVHRHRRDGVADPAHRGVYRLVPLDGPVGPGPGNRPQVPGLPPSGAFVPDASAPGPLSRPVPLPGLAAVPSPGLIPRPLFIAAPCEWPHPFVLLFLSRLLALVLVCPSLSSVTKKTPLRTAMLAAARDFRSGCLGRRRHLGGGERSREVSAFVPLRLERRREPSPGDEIPRSGGLTGACFALPGRSLLPAAPCR